MNKTLNTNAFEFCSPAVVAEKFQEGMVVLNLDTGTYFDVGERLVPLLDALTSGISLSAICEAAELNESGVSQHIHHALDIMIEHNLIRSIPASSQVADPALTQEILDAGTAFVLMSHDDLAELLAADPVHELDPETGRPFQ